MLLNNFFVFCFYIWLVLPKFNCLTRCVLHSSWIGMFDARELGILISGSSTGFNVADLKEHTVYAGGYNEARQLRRIFGSCSNMFNFKYTIHDLQVMIFHLHTFASSASKPSRFQYDVTLMS